MLRILLLVSLSSLAFATAQTPVGEVVVSNVRVSALSPTLVRVEPKGPTGFEDRTTFMVVSRAFDKIPIKVLKQTAGTALLSTEHYQVSIQGATTSSPAFQVLDAAGTAVLYNSSEIPGPNSKCKGKSKVLCTSPCFWDKDAKECTSFTTETNLLHWPSPLEKPAYTIEDFPRFFVPEWGPSPMPSSESALKSTNGYDFTNNIKGDSYVFLLSKAGKPDVQTYHTARHDFVRLAGGTPVLPDFAFGTWFTWWHPFTQEDAKDNVTRWETGKLPIDVWALDMNWRNTSKDNLLPGETGSQDHYYDHPAIPNLFVNYSEWFEWLEEHKLRTYFNDHPFPVAGRNEGGLQTSPEEIAFRWKGLSEWMEKGLTYWWFDHNWGFSIPPPFVNTTVTSGVWDGLDNAAWGSHIYYSSVEAYDRIRDKKGDSWYGGRAIALTKFGLPDWRPGMDPVGHQESPAHHRFPVWWTGDGVPLKGSVESMVDAGVHDFKPYVHSDCGGDYRATGGDLLRWTAHCVFGTILRFHGNDHRPWSYDAHIESVIQSYLNMRYKLAPALIAAGHIAAETGFPLAARGDLFWPEIDEAKSSDQYLFLNDTLVAPLYSDVPGGIAVKNISSRSVWIPPGKWQDAWSGESVDGGTAGKAITATQPFERQPMWHRSGGLVVMTDRPGLRIDDGDWSTLTLDAYPAADGELVSTHRSLFPRSKDSSSGGGSSDGRTQLHFASNATFARLEIDEGEKEGDSERQWVLRLHLRPQQRVSKAVVSRSTTAADGETKQEQEVASASVVHLEPRSAGDDWAYRPFGGTGTPPPSAAGAVAEVRLPARTRSAVVRFG
eukprot:g812.t1